MYFNLGARASYDINCTRRPVVYRDTYLHVHVIWPTGARTVQADRWALALAYKIIYMHCELFMILFLGYGVVKLVEGSRILC